MEGTDGQNYYAVMEFLWKYDYGGNEMRFGNSKREKGNIVVKKWYELNED